MAQRRMFSKNITENDTFLDMPLSTQALYFHLGMQSDDDGFVSPNRIMRMIGCQTDDLKILIGKKFVLPFENGVVVIKHWLINNYIQKDRHTPTTYQENLAMLTIKNNNVYKMYTKCIQNVRVGKVSIGKVSIGKDTFSEETSQIQEIFNIFYSTINRNISFENKTQRKAVKDMIRLQGYDKVKKVAEFACQFHGEPYMPVITTPLQLKDKWSALESWAKTKQQKDNSKGLKIGSI